MATYSWAGGSASWASTLFWTVGGSSDGSVPGTADIATIAAAGSYSIQAQGVAALGVNLLDPTATLAVAGAGLVVNGGTRATATSAVSLVDNGTIAVAAGGQLQVGGAIGGSGIVTLAAGAGLLLNASTTTGGLAGIHGTAGTVTLQGTLDNTGAMLTAAQFGSIALLGETVKGGTLAVPSGVLATSLVSNLVGVALVGNVWINGGDFALDAASTVQPAPSGGTATITLATGEFDDFNSGLLDHVLLSIAGTVATQTTLSGTLGPVASVLVGSGSGIAGLSVAGNQGSIATTGGLLNFTAGFANAGVVAANGGSVTVSGAITGNGTIALSKSGTIELAKSYDQQVFQFVDNTGVLKLDFPAGGTPSTVLGFINNPTIELVANPATTLSLSGDTLTASNGGLTLARFVLPDMPAGSVFAESVDGNSDTFITAHQPAAAGQPVSFTWAPVGGSTDWSAPANWSGNYGYATPGTQAAPPGMDTAIVNGGTLAYAPTLLANVNLQMPEFNGNNGGSFDPSAEVDFHNVELANDSMSFKGFYGDTLTFTGNATLDNTSTININSAFGDDALLNVVLIADPNVPGSVPSFVNNGTINAAAYQTPYDPRSNGETFSAYLRITGTGDFVNNTTLNGLSYANVSLTGTGTINLISGASSSLLGPVGAGQTINMVDSQAYNYSSRSYTTLSAKLEIGDPNDFSGRIALSPTGTITLDKMVAAESYYAHGTLGLSNGMTLRIDLPYSNTTGIYVTHDPYNTLIIAPCFAAGTRIATPRGEITVEHLRVGDAVTLIDGRRAPVVWVGQRRVDCVRHPRPQDVLPVRVCRDAFGDGAPLRDLWLSPDHAVFADGVLVPVRYLINGATIRQEAVPAVRYVHVELAAHRVLLAEGLPCESYLDTGNRDGFEGGGVVRLQADFALGVWAAKACALLVVEGARLVALRTRLMARAGDCGHVVEDDAGLQVWADEVALTPEVDGARWCCRTPGGVWEVRLRSRFWVPGEVLPESRDARRLGVAVAGLRLDGAAVALDDARLVSGWHAAESGFRWTDGEAVLRVAGASVLAFELALSGRYWRGGEEKDRVAWHG